MSNGSANWTASVGNYTGAGPGWLSVNPSIGALTPGSPRDSVDFNVNSAALSAGARGATVTFTAGALTRTVPVTLNVNAVGVNFVAPYVAIAGAGGNVIIRGNGFAGATAVSFGGTPAAGGFTVVSDTEISATHPALPAGNYAVNVTAGGALTTRANLVVIARPRPGCGHDHAAPAARRRRQPDLRRGAPGAVSHGCRQQPHRALSLCG